jgi:hypothetical protein
LAHEEEVYGLEGIRVCINAPSVSYLSFADGSLILMKLNLINATSFRIVLDQYYTSIGKMVGDAKCSIYF